MNRQAVALAADSAVTVATGADQKIFNSAHKIFTLSKYQPIGVMIYGTAAINALPWETVIKEFRRTLVREEVEPTVRAYAKRFFEWLDSMKLLSADDCKRRAGLEVVAEFERILEAAGTYRDDNGVDLDEALVATIDAALAAWMETDLPDDAPEDWHDRVKVDHQTLVEEVRDHLFRSATLTPDHREKLRELGLSALTKWPKSDVPGTTGIVIAGFGDAQYLPALTEWQLCGLYSGYIKRRHIRSAEIGGGRAAQILPFAQWQDAWAFTNGVDPHYQRRIDAGFRTVVTEYPGEIIDLIDELSDEQKRAYKQRLKPIAQTKVDDYLASLRIDREQRFARPIQDTVAALPKDELAAMAESLVNLTSVKRRVSRAAETVGGPIDVAVISRGDGFIWIQRKHYFKQELNRHFMANYFT
jgi:hypothetical protein